MRMPSVAWWAGGLVALSLMSRGMGQEPDVFAAARAAVAAGDLEKSDLAGKASEKLELKDLPSDGAILIGFDLVLSKQSGDEVIHALRPVFRGEKGDRPGKSYGQSSFISPGKGRRVVSLRARPGYAVGAITVRSDTHIEGLSLTYMKVSWAALDPSQKYPSSWYGSQDGNELVIGGSGTLIVGVYGAADDERPRGLGVLQIAEPDGPRKPENRAEGDPIGAAANAAKPTTDPASATLAEEPRKSRTWLILLLSVTIAVAVVAGLFLLVGGKKKPPVRLKRKREFDSVAELDSVPVVRAAEEPAEVVPVAPLSTAVQTSPRAPTVLPGVRSSAMVALPPVSQATAQAAPPFLAGRVSSSWGNQRFYRAYLFPSELILIDAGQAHAKQDQNGFLLYGAIGWLLRRAIADGIRMETDKRQKSLNHCDAEELLALANEEQRNVRAGGEELLAATLEAPTFWSKLFRHGFECRGLLRIRHRTRGEFLLEFLGQQVIREAIDRLPSVLGDRLEVPIRWDRLKGRYV